MIWSVCELSLGKHRQPLTASIPAKQSTPVAAANDSEQFVWIRRTDYGFDGLWSDMSKLFNYREWSETVD